MAWVRSRCPRSPSGRASRRWRGARPLAAVAATLAVALAAGRAPAADAAPPRDAFEVGADAGALLPDPRAGLRAAAMTGWHVGHHFELLQPRVGLAAILRVDYGRAEIDAGAPAAGEALRLVLATAAFQYEWLAAGRATPFVGLGAGLSFLDGRPLGEELRDSVAVLGTIGARVRLIARLSGLLEARVVGREEHALRATGARPGLRADWLLSAGVTAALGGEEPRPAPPAGAWRGHARRPQLGFRFAFGLRTSDHLGMVNTKLFGAELGWPLLARERLAAIAAVDLGIAPGVRDLRAGLGLRAGRVVARATSAWVQGEAGLFSRYRGRSRFEEGQDPYGRLAVGLSFDAPGRARVGLAPLALTWVPGPTGGDYLWYEVVDLTLSMAL